MRWPVGIFAGVTAGIMVFVRFRVSHGLSLEVVPALTVALPWVCCPLAAVAEPAEPAYGVAGGYCLYAA